MHRGRALSNSLAAARADRALKVSWRAPIRTTKRRAEMTVTGKTQVHAERSEVVVAREQIQRARQAQTQLILIQRQGFDTLKRLRQVDGRDADLCGDLSQRPSPRRIGSQHQLGAIHQLLASAT